VFSTYDKISMQIAERNYPSLAPSKGGSKFRRLILGKFVPEHAREHREGINQTMVHLAQQHEFISLV
jgi:hypothetical protein